MTTNNSDKHFRLKIYFNKWCKRNNIIFNYHTALVLLFATEFWSGLLWLWNRTANAWENPLSHAAPHQPIFCPILLTGFALKPSSFCVHWVKIRGVGRPFLSTDKIGKFVATPLLSLFCFVSRCRVLLERPLTISEVLLRPGKQNTP